MVHDGTLAVVLRAAAVALALGGAPALAQQARPAPAVGQGSEVKAMKISIAHDGGTITATLDDTATSHDFLALLPLSLTLRDYAATEKIGDLPRRLSTDGAPPGVAPSADDVTYYAPWGNLALFHRDFGYAPGLVRLGVLDGGQDVLRRPGPLRVTISPAAGRAGSP